MPVTITQGRTNVTGSGLEANNKTQIYVLEGPVHGIFHRNKAPSRTDNCCSSNNSECFTAAPKSSTVIKPKKKQQASSSPKSNLNPKNDMNTSVRTLILFFACGCLPQAPLRPNVPTATSRSISRPPKSPSTTSRSTQVFEGNVILTQGTLVIRTAKLVVTQDAEGFQKGVASGGADGLARFRQKREGKDEYIDGEAERIEYDRAAKRLSSSSAPTSKAASTKCAASTSPTTARPNTTS